MKYTDPDGRFVIADDALLVIACFSIIIYFAFFNTQTDSYKNVSEDLLDVFAYGSYKAKNNILNSVLNITNLIEVNKIKSDVVAKSKERGDSPNRLVIQIQDCTKGSSKKTLGSSGTIFGDPKTGVTKTEGLVALSLAIEDLKQTNKSMTKDPDFLKAIGDLAKDIKDTQGVPSGKNVLQATFKYNGKKYRIDVDSYIDSGYSTQNLVIQ